MAFIVEDGTGRADATSLVDPTTALAYYTDRGITNAFTRLASDAARQAFLVRASDYVRTNPRYRWRGVPLVQTQRMPFPRSGCSERDGLAVAADIVPWRVAEAVARLAGRLAEGEDLLPDLARGGRIKAESLAGVSSTTYMDDAPIGTVLQDIEGLLAPLFRDALDAPLAFSLTIPELPDVMKSDTFAAPGTRSVWQATSPSSMSGPFSAGT